TLWALWVAAEGVPSAKNLFIFVVGVILMRAAGCVINDYADRNFDGHVSRTKARHLASGKVKPREALALFAVRAPVVKSQVGFGLWSRETLLLVNNIVLVVSAAMI
ncbi:UbiA family prenyltransferase, partial [Klebsiella pneumoniae]